MVWSFSLAIRFEDVVLHYDCSCRQWMHRCNLGKTGNAGWSYWCTVLSVDWQLLGDLLSRFCSKQTLHMSLLGELSDGAGFSILWRERTEARFAVPMGYLSRAPRWPDGSVSASYSLSEFSCRGGVLLTEQGDFGHRPPQGGVTPLRFTSLVKCMFVSRFSGDCDFR